MRLSQEGTESPTRISGWGLRICPGRNRPEGRDIVLIQQPGNPVSKIRILPPGQRGQMAERPGDAKEGSGEEGGVRASRRAVQFVSLGVETPADSAREREPPVMEAL